DAGRDDRFGGGRELDAETLVNTRQLQKASGERRTGQADLRVNREERPAADEHVAALRIHHRNLIQRVLRTHFERLERSQFSQLHTAGPRPAAPGVEVARGWKVA